MSAGLRLFFVFAGALMVYIPTRLGVLPSVPKISAFNKYQTPNHELFRRIGSQLKIAFFSNCITGHYSAYNEFKEGQLYSRISPYGRIGQVANSILESNQNIQFYDIGRTNTEIRDHVFYLDHIISNKPADENLIVIYSNDFGGIDNIQTTDPASTLEAVAILERWQTEYPSISNQIEQYKNILKGSTEFQDAERIYSAKWRNLLDQESKTLPRYYAEGDYSLIFSSKASETLSIQQMLFLDLISRWLEIGPTFEKISNARLMIPSIQMLHQARFEKQRLAETRRLIKKVLEYKSGNAEAISRSPILMAENEFYSTLKSNEALRFWVTILSEVLSRNGIKLVYYFPPNPSITPELYSTYFQPDYVNMVATAISANGGKVIDHTTADWLNSGDLIQKKFLGKSYSVGRDVNVIGNTKRIGNLVQDLNEIDVIPASYGRIRISEEFSTFLKDSIAPQPNRQSISSFVSNLKPKYFEGWKRMGATTKKPKFESKDLELSMFESNVWPELRKREIESFGGLLHDNNQYACKRTDSFCLRRVRAPVTERQLITN